MHVKEKNYHQWIRSSDKEYFLQDLWTIINQAFTGTSEFNRKTPFLLKLTFPFFSKGPWLDKGQRILQKLNLPLKFTDLTIDRRIILYNKICENTGNIKSIRAWCDWGTRVQEGHKTLLASFRENFVEGNEVSLFQVLYYNLWDHWEPF